MHIAFVGHVSVDHNVVKGQEQVLYGGGVTHGAMTAHRLGADATIFTKCAELDRPHFAFVAQAGVDVSFLPSATSTSIRNDYPTDNPDDRTSRIVSQGEPFAAGDLAHIEADLLHVNPLWLGEFPPALLAVAKQRAAKLGADAQGFLRSVKPDGRMELRDWADKEQHLPLLDLLKVDLREASVLTGLCEPRPAAERLHELGAKTVLLTHQDGVCVCEHGEVCEAGFSGWTLEGRTGRGDTCTAAFLVGRERMSLGDATRYAAEITSKKMMRASF